METMHAAYPQHPPLRQPSHMPESRPRPSFDQPTRNMHVPDLQTQQLSAPASQESIMSANSYGSSVNSQLQSVGSNASQLTSYTDQTSPSSTAPTTQTEYSPVAIPNDVDVRDKTPEDQVARDAAVDSIVSPASTSTPVATNGTKRTSDGQTKDLAAGSATPLSSGFRGNRSRAASTASSSSSRAGELAANLKARLGYAMTKVQNGWEHKSFSEVERLTAQKAANRHSMSHLDHSRRPMSSGLSNNTSRLSMYDPHKVSNMDGALSPQKRLSGSYSTYAPTRAPYTTATTPRLQPAPDIRPTNGYRSHPYAQPLQRARHNSAMSPPRTPITQQSRRPHPIRTDTQTAEAEREALQALFQLGSPHGSQMPRPQNTSRANSSQASPLRAEFATPRRVTFARSDSAGTSESADSVHESRQRALNDLENK